MEHTASQSLYDLLVTKNLDPEILDSSGQAVSDPSAADLYSFDWHSDGQNYGTVVVLLTDDNDLEVYFGDNLGRSMERKDRSNWYDFLHQLKQFASRNLLTFELNNINRLKYTMQGMAAIKEGLFEGYYGTRRTSYSDQPKKTKLVIQHDRNLGEGDARYRYIESLFIETDQGERFKLPFTKLLGGRAMARHVAEGGTPYDAFGQHISSMMSEMNTLGRFVRAARQRNYDGDTKDLVEAAVRHYQDLKAKAKRMVSQRGYLETRQAFDPAMINDSEITTEQVRNLFLEQNIDRRIEEALPILARLAEEECRMKETQEFESWVDSVTEGTWAVPDTPEANRRLQKLMSQELPVGPDATNSTEQLYDILGDDELFDQLESLARDNPDADARPLIRARLEDMGLDIGMIDNESNQGQDQTQSKPTSAQTSAPVSGMEEDLDTDGVMMTRPSNMSSESIDHLQRLRKLALT